MSETTHLENRLSQLEKTIESLRKEVKEIQEGGMVLIIFSNNMDRVIAALNIAIGGLTMGMKVSLFFTFWGTTLLRQKQKQKKNKLFLQKLFGWMLPKGPEKLPLSQMHLGGMGSMLMGKLMKKYKQPSVSQLLEIVQQSGANIYICTMTMDLMGIKTEELSPIPSLQYCGVAKFMEIAKNEKLCLFI